MKKELKLEDLIKMYKDGESADNSLYNEQRSNLMLVAGNHYTRKGSRFANRIRESNSIPSETKIRLTKNHIQRIAKIYENNILSYAPAVSIEPKNDSELQDQKAAELNDAVWKDICDRLKFRQKTREFCQDFVRIGECVAEIYWDENKGRLIGFEQAVDDDGELEFEMISATHPETGEEIMVMDESQPVMDKKKPRFSGDIVIKRHFGFNVFRDRSAKSMEESPFIGLREMVDVKELKAIVGDDDQKLKYIQASKDETFMIFDGNNMGTSMQSGDQCLVMKVYIKPSINHPNGYYYIYTNAGILFEGELPYGVFPIVFEGFDEVPTNPRYHSIIKHLRPYQAEINRMASSAAENAIANGSDKIITTFGNKIQNGGLLPGVRNIQVAGGGTPQILPGRTGEQWLAPMQQCIEEMYQIANMAEDMQEKPSQVDPYTSLFQTIEQKKKYTIYVTKFMGFLVNIADVVLQLTREYISDDALIPAIGRSEMVNIPEFKNTKPLNYQIKLDSATEDMESKLGKQLMFNHVIQYMGNKIDEKNLGRLIRSSPYANDELALEDLTQDFDNGTNMILSLDRGEQFEPNTNDDSQYMMKRLVSRMRKADFKQLQPQVQQAYQMVYQQFVQLGAEQERKIQEAALGFIPMSGMAVTCDLYVPDPNNSSKTMRARVPYDSLTWLLKRLEQQGTNQAALAEQQKGVVADLATELKKNPAQQTDGAGQNVQPQVNPSQTMG